MTVHEPGIWKFKKESLIVYKYIIERLWIATCKLQKYLLIFILFHATPVDEVTRFLLYTKWITIHRNCCWICWRTFLFDHNSISLFIDVFCKENDEKILGYIIWKLLQVFQYDIREWSRELFIEFILIIIYLIFLNLCLNKRFCMFQYSKYIKYIRDPWWLFNHRSLC